MNKAELLSLKQNLVNSITLMFHGQDISFPMDPEIQTGKDERIFSVFNNKGELTARVQDTGSPLGRYVRALDLTVDALVDILNRTVHPQKSFRIQMNIGRAKYCVSSHDGLQTHKDGSAFYGMEIFSNKRKMELYVGGLVKRGYTEQ